MTKKPAASVKKEPRREAYSPHVAAAANNGSIVIKSGKNGHETPVKEASWGGEHGGGHYDMEETQQFRTLEEDHIEQMIEELLDYESIELCFIGPAQAM